MEKVKVILECKLNKPNKPVKWLKSGKEIKPKDNIQISVDQYTHQLIFTEVTLEDAGKYRAVCGNVSTDCTLKVDGEFPWRLFLNS